MTRAMLHTRCPECRTTFRITEQILQKADGQVRCGRCAHVFDANAFLHDPLAPAEEPAPVSGRALNEILETESDVTPGASGEAASEPAQRPKADIPDEAGTKAGTKAGPKAGTDSGTAAGTKAGTDSGRDEADEAGDEDGRPKTENSGDSRIVSAVREIGLPAWWPELIATESHRRAWAIGAAVLGSILLVQLIHHFRAGLARVPLMGSTVTAIYGMFGSDIARYDLDQYVIVDSAAVAQPDAGEHGWLLIEARVRNKGPRVQPYPYIFLTLENRWQDDIAGRYFAPEEYLVSPVSDSSRMRVGEVVDAQFIIVDPGPEASGFEVNVCVQLDDGFACASDIQLD